MPDSAHPSIFSPMSCLWIKSLLDYLDSLSRFACVSGLPCWLYYIIFPLCSLILPVWFFLWPASVSYLTCHTDCPELSSFSAFAELAAAYPVGLPQILIRRSFLTSQFRFPYLDILSPCIFFQVEFIIYPVYLAACLPNVFPPVSKLHWACLSACSIFHIMMGTWP